MSRLWEEIDGVFFDAPRIGEKDTASGDAPMVRLELDYHNMMQRSRGVELVDKTKKDWYYCIVSGGMVFKCDMKLTTFYRLDMERFIWIPDQTIPIRVFDLKIPFWEFSGFVDYYDELEEAPA